MAMTDAPSLDESFARLGVEAKRLFGEIVGSKDAGSVYDMQTAYLVGYHDGSVGKPCDPEKVVGR